MSGFTRLRSGLEKDFFSAFRIGREEKKKMKEQDAIDKEKRRQQKKRDLEGADGTHGKLGESDNLGSHKDPNMTPNFMAFMKYWDEEEQR